jgi:predicted metal-dependent hydrolase
MHNERRERTAAMLTQLSLIFDKPPRPSGDEPSRDVLVLGRRQWQVSYVRHRRARHYILRVADDGSLRVTIPRGGSRKDAERFARHKADWIVREQYRRSVARRDSESAWDPRLRQLAERELPARLMALATQRGCSVAGVAVRNQRSRWGSCSPSGRISLNWRLVQAPPSVRDYVLLHELTHLAVSNHSPKFWKALEAVCPWHREARAWLRARHIGGCD